MADTWFTSDFHFGHFNIIRYCNRPFESTEEMDAHIADRMNAHVKQNDTLYFLGDFCMGSVEKVTAMIGPLEQQQRRFFVKVEKELRERCAR